MELPTSQPVLCVIKSKKGMSQKQKKKSKGQNMTINVRQHKLEMVSMILRHHATKTDFSGPEWRPMIAPYWFIQPHKPGSATTWETTRPSVAEDQLEVDALIDIHCYHKGKYTNRQLCTKQPTARKLAGVGAQSSTGTYCPRLPAMKACTHQVSPRGF